MITDGSGNVVYSASYSPFGKLHKVWLNTYDPSLKFSGKEREATSGDDYFGARYFSGDNYRFLSVDPVRNRTEALANPKLWNLYSYCRNNPITFLDPDGRDFKYFKPSTELKRQMVAAGLHFDYRACQLEGIINAALFFFPMSPGTGVMGIRPSSGGGLKNWIKKIFGRSKPRKMNQAQLQPYHAKGTIIKGENVGGHYASYDSSPGILKSPVSDFSKGFSKGFISGYTPANTIPLASEGFKKAFQWGQKIGKVIGTILGGLFK